MMDRRTFVKQSCFACMGIGLGSMVFGACKTVHYANGTIKGDQLVVPLSDFAQHAQQGRQSQYLLVRHESLQYPVCVYRFADGSYKALWMRCTHQGAELQVLGDTMLCQAHGSEFDNRGRVTNGPADQPLRAFEVQEKDQSLMISLK